MYSFWIYKGVKKNDIVQVAVGGIVEEDPEELKKAIAWLKETQDKTEAYKTLDIPFEVE